jgi:hypothetical protein
MRTTLLIFACASAAASSARAQTATITGQVVSREGSEPLGFTTVAVVSQGIQRLASESGTFTLRDLPAGDVRLRLSRIGFTPKDTTLTLRLDGAAHIHVEMTRLALRLPQVVVNGTCTDRTPFEARPADIAELLDQVRQNAERMRLLANERPFVFHAVSVGGYRDREHRIIGSANVDTLERGPLPLAAYVPRRIISRGRNGAQNVMLPELPHLADTAFTNNHCLWYAGHERFGSDSVIRVDFEPVPWLAKDVDFEGSIYLRADGYQLVGLFTKLNRIPASNRLLAAYTVRARFGEIVSGVPVLAEWELTNTFHGDRPPFVQTGRVIGVTWRDSGATKHDTSGPPPR